MTPCFVEVLLKGDSARLSPVFDNGLSFLFSTYDQPEKIEKFNLLGTGIVNNWFGSMDVKENLVFYLVEIEGGKEIENENRTPLCDNGISS